MLNRLLNWLSRLFYGGVKPVSRTGATVYWVRGVGWMERSREGILPSKYQMPEEIEAFKKEVDKVTREVENQSSDSFPGIRL